MDGAKSATKLSKSIECWKHYIYPRTIKNCFLKAGFYKGEATGFDFDDQLLPVLANLLKNVKVLRQVDDRTVEVED